jgi:uncharacterized protein (TIGR03382 family)
VTALPSAAASGRSNSTAYISVGILLVAALAAAGWYVRRRQAG